MSGKAQRERKLSEKQKAALKAHAFPKGKSGCPGGDHTAAIERTKEGNAILDECLAMKESELRALKTPSLPVKKGVIVKRLVAALDREGTARSEVCERILGRLPQPLTGKDGEEIRFLLEIVRPTVD